MTPSLPARRCSVSGDSRHLIPQIPSIVPALRLLDWWYQEHEDGGPFAPVLEQREVEDGHVGEAIRHFEESRVRMDSEDYTRLGRQVARMLVRYSPAHRRRLVACYHDVDWASALPADDPGQPRTNPGDVDEIHYEDGGWSVTSRGDCLFVAHAATSASISIELPDALELARRYQAALRLLTSEQLERLERELAQEAD